MRFLCLATVLSKSFYEIQERGANILGNGGLSDIDEMPYMTLTYANGPGYTYHTTNEGRLNLTAMTITDYKFVHPATVPMVRTCDRVYH